LPKQTVCVFADRVRLTEAFKNLLDNSAESTNPGRCISLVADLEDAGVAVRITSGGDLPGDDSAFAELQGLGVGLSRVWELVEMHGGSVEVNSRGSGIGREFTVHLPVMAELPVDSDPALSPPVPSLRVLIAEDNPDAAATLAMSLRFDGHQVEIAHDGTEALNIAETFRPQVALLDIGMPRISGYELAEKIRGRSWGKEALLIAQTGWGRAQDWEKAVVSGFNFHLTKPLNYDALTKILDNFSNHSPATALPDNKSNAA
jgi:CheY-like chemotaxis protein